LTIAPTVYSDAGCLTKYVQRHPSRSPRFFHHFNLPWRHEPSRRARYTGSPHSRVRLHAIRPSGASLMHFSPPTIMRGVNRSSRRAHRGGSAAARSAAASPPRPARPAPPRPARPAARAPSVRPAARARASARASGSAPPCLRRGGSVRRATAPAHHPRGSICP
jgi:hypothetical protein